MKLILTGATGFVGGEVLRQALADDRISSVVVLTRRSLPGSPNSSKLKTLVIEDFTSYSDDVKSELADAHGCIWAMGTIPRRARRDVDVDYPLAALNTLAALFDANKPAQKFRFLYLSGQFAEQDKNKDLWLIPFARKLKGETEYNLLRISEENPDVFDPYITRPGGITSRANWITAAVMPLFFIRVDQLVAGMLDIIINGGQSRINEHRELAVIGRRAMKGKST